MLTGLRRYGPWMAAVCILLTAWSQSAAQNVRATVNHPAGLTRMLVDTPALINVGDADDPEYIYQPAGRFQLRTGANVAVGGSPLVAGDEDRPIASLETAAPDWNLTQFTSKLTVSVDGVRFDPYSLMFNQTEEADPADVPIFWVQDLVAGARDVVGEVLVPLLTEVPEEDNPNVRVRVNYMLVHDGIMLDHIVYNDDSVAHNIGLRLMIDALFGATARDGSPIILDDGTVISNEVRIPDPDNPTIAMPDTWVAHDDPSNPLVSVRGTLVGAEVTDAGIASESGGEPDEIAFGQFRNVDARPFDFQPNPRAALIDEDWAYAVKWEERTLQPGQSRRYVTYYGLGAAAVDYDPPYALAAYAPSQLQVQEGDDPATPETEEYYLTAPDGSSVFDVVAMLDNFGSSPLTNASVRISLPEGLELYPETQPRTVALGMVRRNQSPLPMAQWTVRATATRPGTAEISITGPLGKVVRRQINIPAIPVIPARVSATGLEMLSVPYEFTNSDASNVLGSLSDSVFPGGPVGIWRWHPDRGEYFTYPDPFVANIELGEGFWLLNQNRETVILPSTATQAPSTQSFTHPLMQGWNQIGNPYVVPMRFDQVGVVGPQGTEWTIQEATQRGLILPVLYAYDPEINEYTWESSLQRATLVPFEGYWLLAYRDVSLVFPPPSLFAPAEVTAAASPPVSDGWRVGVEVSCAGRTRAPRYLAVSPSAEDGVDPRDVPSPPEVLSAEPGLDAYFSIGDGGLRYVMDTRSEAAGAGAWDLTVVAETPGAPVTLRWPNLSSELPEDLVATLEDLDGGRRTYMRTSSSYTYNSHTGGERHFRITVRPRAEATLGLTAAARPAGGQGLEIVYTLNSAAAVDVQVRNIAGRVVRRVAQNRQAMEGQNSLVWNGVSDSGTVVPAGRYLVQVTARSPETGEEMSVIRTATIAR
ncbi:MAG: FlgD immunoglobulin-like domain containing protein [Armatimonadota bacterium]|nr:FlgD immunoglobulin-like domain containing protein [Armatimonadota bacterium]